MIIKYAVFNHLAGNYIKVDSEEEAKKLYVKFIIELYNNYVHDQPYVVVEIDNDGNETWKQVNNGTDIPEEYLTEIIKAI